MKHITRYGNEYIMILSSVPNNMKKPKEEIQLYYVLHELGNEQVQNCNQKKQRDYQMVFFINYYKARLSP